MYVYLILKYPTLLDVSERTTSVYGTTITGFNARELMASRRKRAGAAMAAVDRRNPNVDDFLGLNWSCWVDRVKTLPTDGESQSLSQTWFPS